jgi:hypothetical protein
MKSINTDHVHDAVLIGMVLPSSFPFIFISSHAKSQFQITKFTSLKSQSSSCILLWYISQILQSSCISQDQNHTILQEQESQDFRSTNHNLSYYFVQPPQKSLFNLRATTKVTLLGHQVQAHGKHALAVHQVSCIIVKDWLLDQEMIELNNQLAMYEDKS